MFFSNKDTKVKGYFIVFLGLGEVTTNALFLFTSQNISIDKSKSLKQATEIKKETSKKLFFIAFQDRKEG